ncbi:MAG: hypothetical protein ABIH59_01750 [archaeon]
MSFIGFLKKITGQEIIKEPTKERVAFSEIANWIQNKEKEVKDKENQVFILIKNKVLISIKELNEKVSALETFDLDSKKDKDKIKLIVKENLNNYIDHVKDFITSLNDLEEESFETFIIKTNAIFTDFDKNSYTNYQKATLLIGKEMATIKESTLSLSKYFEKTFKENKDIVSSSKILASVKLKLKEINEIDKSIEKNNNNIKDLENKISSIKEKDKKLLEEIENLKKSKEYLENLEKKDKVKSIKEKLEQEISNLRQLIDFKALTNFFHINKEDMSIVKEHKEDFKKEFKKDNGERILNLLNESNLITQNISSKLEQINEKNKEIIKIQGSIKKDETEVLLDKSKELNLEIEEPSIEKAKEQKNKERIQTKRKDTIDSIRQILTNLDVVLFGS